MTRRSALGLAVAGLVLVVVVSPASGGPDQQPHPQRYAFYPQAGVLERDLVVTNFVDVDPLPGIRDFSCGTITYDGHGGHDTIIRSFREQTIGVPVFAALDGVVIDAADGFPDKSTSTGSGVPGNFVLLDHGGGHTTMYDHLRQGSVDLPIGARVRAGRQIGLTASSGNSTWPHLHFESRMNGVVFEPSAGECRPGESGWTQHVPIRRDLFVRSLTLSARDFRGRAGLPFDEGTRTGTFVAGRRRTIAFRIELENQPAQASYQLRVRSPGGRITGSRTGDFSTPFRRASEWWWRLDDVRLDKIGNWRIVFWMNDVRLASAPFRVVARAAEVVNRPPVPVSVAVEPLEVAGGHAIRCVVSSPLARRDPDYDVVSYVYRWTLGRRVLRTVTSAALSDMIPAGAAAAGGSVTCSVAPSDGRVKGVTVSASVAVAASPIRRPGH